jgi:hypothetical protein
MALVQASSLARIVLTIGTPRFATGALDQRCGVRSERSIAPHALLHRDADRDPNTWVASVVQVIAVVDIADIDLVIVVPVVAPVGRPRVNDTQPVAVVLEARIPANHDEGQALNTETMVRAEITAKTVVRNAISVVATALLPCAMVRLPVPCPVLLPGSLLDMLLCLAWLWRGASLLPGVLLLPADGRVLRLPSLWGRRLGGVRRFLLPGGLLLSGRWSWLLLALRRGPGLLVWAVLFRMILVFGGPVLSGARQYHRSDK